MLFQRPGGKPVFYTTAPFQTSDGDEARQVGCRQAALGRHEEAKRQRLDRDIDIGDGTINEPKQDINDREVLGTSKGNVTESHHASTTTTTMKLPNTKVKETIAKVRGSGVKTNNQLKKIVKGIMGEEGRARMYKEEGAGLSKAVKGGGARLGETVKGKCASPGQDTGDIVSSYSYPLVDPRPEEAPRQR